MKKSLEQKKLELEQLKKEVENEEALANYLKEVAEAKKSGLYIPIAKAIVKYNLYYKSERDFEELGDGDWYTTNQILGDPHLKKDTKVVLLKINDDGDSYWYAEKQSGDYFGIENGEIGLNDGDDEWRKTYLKDVVKL